MLVVSQYLKKIKIFNALSKNIKNVCLLSFFFFLSTILMYHNHLFARSKTHKKLKRTFFNWTKQDKTCEFLRKSSLSKLCTPYKEKNKQSIHLAFVSLMLGCWQKEKGSHILSCFIQIKSVLFNPLCVLKPTLSKHSAHHEQFIQPTANAH